MKSDKRRLFNNQSGITLIALVITVIVLIILAAVTINIVIGQNGIINRTNEAAIKHKNAATKEKIQLEMADVTLEHYIFSLEEITLEELGNKLRDSYGYEIELNSEKTELKIKKDKVQATIDKNFILTLKGEEKDETPPTATLEYDIVVPTAGNVVAKIIADEEILPIDGWNRIDSMTYTKSYSDNINEEVEIKDVSGNVALANVIITNIRKGSTNTFNKTAYKELIDLDLGAISMDLIFEGMNLNNIQPKLVEFGYTVTPNGDHIIIEKNGGLATINASIQVTVILAPM